MAYLTDEGFHIQTQIYDLNPLSISFVLIKKNYEQIEPVLFTWNDIKDHYISLLQMIEYDYNILLKNVQFTIAPANIDDNIKNIYYSVNDLLEDDINNSHRIYFIKILITEK